MGLRVLGTICLLFIWINMVLAGGRTRGRDKDSKRDPKLLSVFQIVTFPNDPCAAGGKNGTCYTGEECTSRGGANGGSCASGYGVCCTFSVGCGGMSSENCTYFESSSGVSAGRCAARVCPCGDNICQLRLDFQSFVVTGPTTASVSVGKVKISSGGLDPAGTIPVALASQCLTDRFDVTASTNSIPTICGTNTGEHVYVDADRACNDLVFQFGQNAIGATSPTRQFSIKVTQYSCDYPNLAPSGCTQYFFGQGTDSVETFNYNNGNGQHLAYQDQTICVRRERGNCRICWYAAQVTDFDVSGMSPVMGFAKTIYCCAVSGAAAADVTKGYDCVNIPGAESINGAHKNSNICGRNAGLVTVTGAAANAKTICSTRTPFYIRFRSDAYEYTGAAIKEAGVTTGLDNGFRLAYTMDSTNC